MILHCFLKSSFVISYCNSHGLNLNPKSLQLENYYLKAFEKSKQRRKNNHCWILSSTDF